MFWIKHRNVYFYAEKCKIHIINIIIDKIEYFFIIALKYGIDSGRVSG